MVDEKVNVPRGRGENVLGRNGGNLFCIIPNLPVCGIVPKESSGNSTDSFFPASAHIWPLLLDKLCNLQ